MAEPTHTRLMKGESTKRNAPPHPNNSGASALKVGIDRLVEHRAEKETKPTRPQGA